ncbi:MAG: ATP-dependent Clp protease proteolytic subunit [Clostridia bacterium]|nr:ATP-dependent Clp protease proteolytic subunit [Clostridia bacterium]
MSYRKQNGKNLFYDESYRQRDPSRVGIPPELERGVIDPQSGESLPQAIEAYYGFVSNPSRVSCTADGSEGEAAPPDARDAGREVFRTGSITVGGEPKLHCITIIGQVEGHFLLPSTNKTTKYEHIIPLLVAVEEDPDIAGLLVVLNTVGGDVEAGLAIAELISGMKKPKVSLVLGGGHSIGVPLAVAADCSFIVPSATMTIHPVRMNGPLLSAPQTMAYFERMQDRITRFVCANSRMKPERFNALLMDTGQLVSDIGSILDGEAAVREGLIDRLGGLQEAIAELRRLAQLYQTNRV